MLMEYGDIPNCMTRAAATGDESPCQAVRPPTGRVSGTHPTSKVGPAGSAPNLRAGDSGRLSSITFRSLIKLPTHPFLQPVLILSTVLVPIRSKTLLRGRCAPSVAWCFPRGTSSPGFSLLCQQPIEKP